MFYIISETAPVLLSGTFILNNKEWEIECMCGKLETTDKCGLEP